MTQPVAKDTTKEDVAAAVATKLGGETAKEVKALDKTKLENYIAEIEQNLQMERMLTKQKRVLQY